MKFYFAGDCGSKDLSKKMYDAGGRKRLYSFYTLEEDDLEEGTEYRHALDNCDVFLDSGAFSAWTRGTEIKVEDYIKFCKLVPSANVIASLDVIDNPERSHENFMKMRDAGVNCIPTFHYGSDGKYLKRMLKDNDYIALGGLVRRGALNQFEHLKWCWSIIKEYWPVKVHAFGYSNMKGLKKFPFYSSDSTNSLYFSKLGRLVFFSTKGMKAGWYRDRKFGAQDFTGVDRGGESKMFERRVHNMKEYLKMEEFITNLWAHRGIVWED